MWESEPFSRSQAWIDMLMLANHKPGVIFRRGVKVEIPRGGIGKSIRTLAERWSWSHGKVERFFSFLLDEEMVKKVGTKKTSVDSCYFIVNYEKYQDCVVEDGGEDGEKTGRRRGEDGDGTRKEEGKNGRKEVKDFCAEPQKDEVQTPQQTEPPLIVFPLSKKGEEQAFYQNDIDQWRESFPGVDLRRELLKCRQWNIDNPTKRKTRSGIRTHISSWLGKAQNGQQGINATSGRNSKVNVRDKAALLKSKTAEFLNGQNYIDNGENNESIGSGGNLLLEHQIP